MKIMLIVALAIVGFLSCKSTHRGPANSPQEIQEKIDQKFSAIHTEFEEITKQAVNFRLLALRYFQENECKITKTKQCVEQSKSITFTAKDLELLYSGMGKYLSLREELLMRHLAPNTSLLPIGFANMDNEVNSSNRGFDLKVNLDKNKMAKAVVNYDPADYKTREFFIRLKYAVAAGLMVYDMYLMGISPYAENADFRYKINSDFKARRKILMSYNVCSGTVATNILDPNEKNARQDVLETISDEFNDNCRRILLSKALRIVLADWRLRSEDKSIVATTQEQYLDQLILSSPFFKQVSEGKSVLGFLDKIEQIGLKISTALNWYKRGAAYYVSKGFGNTVGSNLLQFRSGKMKGISTQQRNSIKAKLRSMDILQEKTPFRLTDKAIPGYYGHAAIWIGTKEELQALTYPHPETKVETPVWDMIGIDRKTGKVDPILTAKYQKLIESGHHIIEALRPGVEINTLDHFLDIDDFLAIRDESLSDRERAKFALKAFEQVGKDYDFNFDVETDERIVCSEIVYVVYHGYEWPTDKTAGRYTISPDHVAWEADGGCFKPVSLWVDGVEIKKDLQKKLSQLINGPEGIKVAGKTPLRRKNSCVRERQE